MEPGHGDREDVGPPGPAVIMGPAAMEPGHGDREDPRRDRRAGPRPDGPLWSPVTETGKTSVPLSSNFVSCRRPLWSPVTETGKTTNAYLPGEDSVAAAMEPGHGDREDLINGVGLAVTQRAAMEPGHGDREDFPFDIVVDDERMTGRYGARSRRPGRRVRSVRTGAEHHRPLWSPVTETGKT